MKTALINDWLVTIGGGEKTLEAIYDLFPSPIYTLVKDEKQLKNTFFEGKQIETSFLQKIPKAPKLYRHFLPLFPLAIEQFDLSDYELILSTSHAVAKGVLTNCNQLHICYCLTPMRYAWDLYHRYLEGVTGAKGKLAKLALHYLRNWDIASSQRVDHYIAISRYISKRIQKIYGRSSHVIYPPVATHLFEPAVKKESYYVTASRFVPYKKIDLIVSAFAKMPDKKLIVIGDGPEMHKVKAVAQKNVELLGFLPDPQVREYLSKAKAFVFAAEEDFGITVVEAEAAGTPVIAFGKGGALETILEHKTGLFFKEQTPQSLIAAVEAFEKTQDQFDPQLICQHAQQFSEDRFKREFKQYVQEKIEEFHESHHSCRR
jgi:glycosyltransferase involved in cell wall biosynthesis